MPVTINGTTGIAGVAGSATTPAYQGTDTDSGFFINSANQPTASVNGTAVWNSASSFGFKNRIINGAMMIDQRNAGASVTPPNGDYTLDRWQAYQSSASAYSVQQNAGSVTPPEGFKNYLGATSLATTNVSAGDYYIIDQKIEGLNMADLNWGTANAKTITLSFWVRSSLTGTFGGALLNAAQNRSYPFSYTISSANTWEKKSITIAGDTSGTWLTTNGIGVNIFFSIGMGSTYSGTAGAWAGATYYSSTGATNVVSTNGATWYLTGVQFEVGSTATSFDFRSIGTELALCQRYFSKLSAETSNAYVAFGSNVYTGSTSANGFVKYPNTMRASPTLSYGGSISFGRGIALVNITSVGTTYAGKDSVLWQPNGLTGGTDKEAGVILANNDTSAFISFSSEI